MSYIFIDRRLPKLTVALAPIDDVKMFKAVYKKVYGFGAYPLPLFVAIDRRKVDTDDVQKYVSDAYQWAATKIKRVMAPKPSLRELLDELEPISEPEAHEPLTVENLMPTKEFLEKLGVSAPDEPVNCDAVPYETSSALHCDTIAPSDVLKDEGCQTWYNFRALTEKWLPAITVMKQEDIYSAIVRLDNRLAVLTYDEVTYLYKHADFFNDVTVKDVIWIPSRTAIPPRVLYWYATDSIGDDAYFLRFTYDIRKITGAYNKPGGIKSRVLKKIMEYMYNHYEFEQDADACIAYGDVFDEIAEHDSYEKVAEALGWLGYMIKEGNVLHVRRRNAPLDVTIVFDEFNANDRTGKQLPHKLLGTRYFSGFRSEFEVPFKHVSPWNTCSI